METPNVVDTLALMACEAAKILNRDTIPVDVALTELGVDSLNVIELILLCEQLYGAFDPAILNINEFTTLNDLDAQLIVATTT